MLPNKAWVVSLHPKSSYLLRYEDCTGEIHSITGIKQGCKLAPSLFALEVSHIFSEVGLDVGPEQVQAFLTGFADVLVSAQRHSLSWREDLLVAHKIILSLLVHLQDAGLQVKLTPQNVLSCTASNASSYARPPGLPTFRVHEG